MGIVEDVREAVKLVQQVDNIDLYRKILDLQAEVQKMVQQNREKDETISRLEQALELKGKMVCEHSAYFLVDEEGNKKDGPFCTNCWDNEHATRRLVGGCRPKDKQGGFNLSWVQCPKCKVPFFSTETGRYLRMH